MAWLFKTLGLIIIMSACSLAGFFKSFALKRRHKKLQNIYRSMSELRERIRMGTGEIENLVYLSFNTDTVCLQNGNAVINTMYL